jgi:hypothetical protein
LAVQAPPPLSAIVALPGPSRPAREQHEIGGITGTDTRRERAPRKIVLGADGGRKNAEEQG